MLHACMALSSAKANMSHTVLHHLKALGKASPERAPPQG